MKFYSDMIREWAMEEAEVTFAFFQEGKEKDKLVYDLARQLMNDANELDIDGFDDDV